MENAVALAVLPVKAPCLVTAAVGTGGVVARQIIAAKGVILLMDHATLLPPHLQSVYRFLRHQLHLLRPLHLS